MTEGILNLDTAIFDKICIPAVACNMFSRVFFMTETGG